VVIEEVKNGSGVVSQLLPWYAFASLWRLITYVYPLLPYYITTSEYLNIVSRHIAKTKKLPTRILTYCDFQRSTEVSAITSIARSRCMLLVPEKTGLETKTLQGAPYGIHALEVR
jgi:hypothetical protein